MKHGKNLKSHVFQIFKNVKRRSNNYTRQATGLKNTVTTLHRAPSLSFVVVRCLSHYYIPRSIDHYIF